LLSVMSEHHLREACCGKAQCGSCAVKIVPQRADAVSHPIVLSPKEKRALLKSRKLSWPEFDANSLNDMPALWRLACQYVIRDEPILVAF
jgi:ferredoxin